MTERTIEAKELTVAQVKEIIENYDKTLHTIDFLFPGEGIPALAVSKSTGLSMEELDGDIPVSEMLEIMQKVKERNPFFLTMMKSLAMVGENLLKRKTGESSLIDLSAD